MNAENLAHIETKRDADWVQTYTGRKVFPLYLHPAEVCIEDIAHALSNVCRFTGHSSAFYSVAQHSVYVSFYCEPADALAGLLHDATEAYLLDLPRPLKRHADFAFYRTAEADAHRAIAAAFGLPEQIPASVLEADARILATEARDLMSPLHPDWIARAEPYPRRVYPWSPELAKELFTNRFFYLTAGAGQWQTRDARLGARGGV